VCYAGQLQRETETYNNPKTLRQLKITQKLTNRNSPALDKYLSDISSIGLITAQREVELAIRIQKGDRKALDEMVNSNLRFVVSVAKQYQGQGLTLIDLISEGNLGLHKAATRFDHTKGFKFISYAVWWIRQHILSALAQQSRTVRLPLNKITVVNKIRGATADLMQIHERAPTSHEIADYIGVTVAEVELCLSQTPPTRSLDAPISSDPESNNLLSVLPNVEETSTDHQLKAEDLQMEIMASLNTLTDREREVMILFYGLGNNTPETLEEIAESMDLTRERIRQIKEKGLRRLRHDKRSANLKPYLG
jgi:RNA polymerase primary sigma factor